MNKINKTVEELIAALRIQPEVVGTSIDVFNTYGTVINQGGELIEVRVKDKAITINRELENIYVLDDRVVEKIQGISEPIDMDDVIPELAVKLIASRMVK